MTEYSINIPVHPAIRAKLGNRQQLLVKLPHKEEFGRLRSTLQSTPETAYDFLMDERNNWIRNGHPEYFNAEYRIENYSSHW